MAQRLFDWRLMAVATVALAATARADTSLNVDLGWGGYVRAHRWAPVVVTASDPANRNVVLKVNWPHGGNYEMNVEQVFGIGPIPRSFSLLLPVHSWYGYQDATFALADAQSGRTLAVYPPTPGSWPGMSASVSSDGGLVGISGRRATLESLRGNIDQQQLGIAYILPGLLPSTAMGFDSLDLLVLNQPNLGLSGNSEDRPIDPAQQQAILDWVRVGGSLIVWPSGVAPISDNGPIAEALPGRPGSATTLKSTPGELRSIGLQQRFRTIPTYTMTPAKDSKAIRLFNGAATAYSRRYGLGRIIVVPFCVSDLQFLDETKAQQFWRGLLDGVHVLPAAPEANGVQPPRVYSSTVSSDDGAETAAAMSVADQLGDVPGAGQFGFGYVAIVLIGMMVVVGPVDWFVLKKLGRQPWTWVTTSGWILLVTLGATSLGYILKSGDLHFRTLRMVDQVDDFTVASIDCVGIYSPMTRQYAIAASPESWWQPSAVEDFGGRSTLPMSVYFHQTYEGNVPEPMRINVWSLRFLRGDQVGIGPPVIAASLSREPGTGRIIGRIKNLTDRPLKNLRVRVGDQIGELTLRQDTAASTLPATHETAGDAGMPVTNIQPLMSVRVEAVPVAVKPEPANDERRYNYYSNTQRFDKADLWKAAGRLDMRRAHRIDQLIAGDSCFVCVLAEADDPPAAVRLVNPSPVQQHWQFIRAVIELQKPGETQ